MATGVVVIPEQQPDRSLWRPLTVRVAWDLVMAGVKVRPAVLADAREHVMRCLPEGVGPDEAERLASLYTHDFLQRVRQGRYRRPSPDPDVSLVIPPEWRQRLAEVLDPVAEAVLRMHYGDGHTLQAMQQHAAVGRAALANARESVRGAARILLAEDGAALGADGLSVDTWSEKRLDRLISRIANQAEERCPGPVGLLSEAGREHADRCPRCSRALRLIRSGTLSSSDLFVPENRPLVPPGQITLLAVLLHPDGRAHRRTVARALGDQARRTGEDAWLVPAETIADTSEALRRLAETGTPPRHQLRGAMVTGPGRWHQGVVSGPLPVLALEAARSRPWSEIDGVGELPPPLPPAPRATRWWLVAAATGLLAALAGQAALSPRLPSPMSPIEASFRIDDGEVVARFDTEDLAAVDVIAKAGAELRIFAANQVGEKGRWSTGEGDFQVSVPGQRVVLVSSPAGVPGLETLVAAAQAEGASLETLAERIRAAEPRADVAISPPLSPGLTAN